jgi:murein DD-endopeptidase MepM/ murein hydrolase activator NlpD
VNKYRKGSGVIILKNIFLTIVLICLPLLANAGTEVSPTLIIQPKKIGPGDVVTIVTGTVSGPVEGTFNGKSIHFNSAKKTSKAIIGIDLNIEPGKYPLEVIINGKKILKNIRIVKKKYPIQRLTLPGDMVELSPENEARADREQARTDAIWPVDSVRFWRGNFIEPLPGKELGTPFGVRRIINKIPKNSHSGVDVTAEEGEPVHAPNNGVAVLVDDLFFSGNSVVLDHGQGIYTMFFHLSKSTVKRGHMVMKGDVIGLVGSTGRSTGAHLHWGVRMQGARVDPLKLIKLELE